MERYKRIKRLGAGAQGYCYLVRDKKTGKLYVSKDIGLSMIGLEQRQAALKESTILQDLSAHPNVITYFNNKLDRKKQILHIIIEYADGGDLEQQIHLRRNLLEEQLEAGRTKNESSPPSADHQDLSNYAPFFFKEEHVLLVFVQTLAGLFHLHSRSILHRDIKSQNIFLSSDGLIKLGDFGIARRLNKDNMAETYVGSPCYMSPELYKREPYNYKSDIWALGCVLFELCCLRKPFHGSNIVVLAMQVTSNKPPAHLDTPPGLYPPPLHHLVNRMLQVDPAERPSAAEIMATPYILRSMKKLIKRYPQLHYLQCYLNDLSCSVAKELPPSNPPFDGCDSSEANRASAVKRQPESSRADCVNCRRRNTSLNPLTAPTIDALFESVLHERTQEAPLAVSIMRSRKVESLSVKQSTVSLIRDSCPPVGLEPRGEGVLPLRGQLFMLWKRLAREVPNYFAGCGQGSIDATFTSDTRCSSSVVGGCVYEQTRNSSASPVWRRGTEKENLLGIAFPIARKQDKSGSCDHDVDAEDDTTPATIPWRKLSGIADDGADSKRSSFSDCPPTEMLAETWLPSNVNANLLSNPFYCRASIRSGDPRICSPASVPRREHHGVAYDLRHALKIMRKRAHAHKWHRKRNSRMPEPSGQSAATSTSSGCPKPSNHAECRSSAPLEPLLPEKKDKAADSASVSETRQTNMSFSKEHFPENSYHAEIKYNSEPLPAASNVESKTKPAAERVGGRSSTRPVAGNTEDKVYLSDEPQRPSFITLKALLNESLVFDE